MGHPGGLRVKVGHPRVGLIMWPTCSCAIAIARCEKLLFTTVFHVKRQSVWSEPTDCRCWRNVKPHYLTDQKLPFASVRSSVSILRNYLKLVMHVSNKLLPLEDLTLAARIVIHRLIIRAHGIFPNPLRSLRRAGPTYSASPRKSRVRLLPLQTRIRQSRPRP